MVRKSLFPVGLVLLLILVGAGCQATQEAPESEITSASPAEGDSELPGRLQLTSSAFSEGDSTPAQYTCDGQDISPPLNWVGVPPGTQSLALIVDDPDAPGGTWVHWVLYDIAPERSDLPEGVPLGETTEGVGTQGENDFRKNGYKGPCPPAGTSHRYFFKLYALDTPLNLPPGAKVSEVETALLGHVLDEVQLIGQYGR